MAKTKQERLAAIHIEAIVDFDAIQGACREQRMQCLQDRRFYSISGAQWEGPIGDQFENKPRFEFNDVHLAVIRIVNEYRNNRITVDFQPKDGSDNDEFADVCDGLYRADEQRCTANEAYDNAFEEGAAGGLGAWRLRAVYEDDEDDENEAQRIEIEPIFDADSCVFFDLGAKRQDKSDAKRCYVLTPYPVAEYIEEFNDNPASWPKGIHQSEFDWFTPDLVWVAELYRVEEKSELVRFFTGLLDDGEELRITEAEIEDDPAMLDELLATGFREVRQKRIKRRVIHKYLMSGGSILEDCGIIPGRCIPVVPYYGKRWVVDGVERCMGHVRLAKDAQRLKNMLLSWLAEMSARFDIEKPILTPEQVLGHATMWAEDNIKKFPYLLINPMTDENGQRMASGPVGYTKAPNIPPAMAALAQIASQALQDLLGNQQAGEEVQPNMSGKAMELVQTRLDMQVFIYVSNFAKAMKRSGEVWLSMMKDIAVEKGRKMKTLGENGQASSVLINHEAYDKETETVETQNDFARAAYEVVVDVGPSSTSRRAATVRSLTGLMQMTQDPETQSVLSGLAIMNLEGEGISDVRDFFRAKLVRQGVLKPTKDEAEKLAQEMQNQQPDPQAQALLAMAEEATAKAGKARADTVETIASADLKVAQTAKTYAEISSTENADLIAGVESLQKVLQGSQLPSVPFGAQ